MTEAPEQIVTITDPKTLALMRTPAGFAAAYLGMEHYPWQIEFVNRFGQIGAGVFMAAMVTPNGAGKSSQIVACIALWWLWFWPKGTVILTTKDTKQLDQQAWPAIEPGIKRAFGPRAHVVTSPYYEVKTDTGGRLVAFTTNDAARVEGYHEQKDGPVLYIVDEAKSVESSIFEGIDRNGYNALLYISSPGLQNGPFYEACTKFRIQDGNPNGLFYVREVSLRECPHVKPEKIDRMIKKYGINHPLVQSSIFGKFMAQDEATAHCFPLAVINRTLENPPQWKRGDRVCFSDFAAGGDENVLAVRDGNKVAIEATWREKDTMAACGRFVIEYKTRGFHSSRDCFADQGGLGRPMLDALRRMGHELQGVNNGGRAHNHHIYDNRGTEIWHETAMAMERGEILMVPDDDLRNQLSSRRIFYTPDGKLFLESKKDMAKRGIKSPDRADAFCGAWASKQVTTSTWETEASNMEQWAASDMPDGQWIPPGADPGY